MPHRILLGGAFLYLTTANVVWLMWDPGLIPPEAGAISEYVNGDPESFRLVEAFPIPSGDITRLYQVRADSERVG